MTDQKVFNLFGPPVGWAIAPTSQGSYTDLSTEIVDY